MEDRFIFTTKNNPYLIQTAQKYEYNGNFVYVVIWDSVDEDGEDFVDSIVYKYDIMKKLLDDGKFIKQ